MRAGMRPEEARRAALLKFGGMDAAKENYRDQQRLPLLEALFADLRYAARGLRKSPAFTMVAVLTLAVGIGANTAVFSLVDQVLLRPQGMTQPERIIQIRTRYKKLNVEGFFASLRTMADLRESTEVVEYAAAAAMADANYTGNGSPERLVSATVTADWFHVFGTKPILGRTFTPESDQPNNNREVVLSHGAWLRLYGGDANVLGRSIELNDVPRQIIGVMPPDFRQPQQAELWTASGLAAAEFGEDNRFNEATGVVARLRSGVSLSAANQWMRVLTQRVHESKQSGAIARDAGWSISAEKFIDANAGETQTQLWMLFGAVGLVAFIACANIAGLLLARASARTREFAVRTALGANQGQLLRGILTESVLLAAMGGVVGMGLAFGGIQVLLSLAPPEAVAGLGPRLDTRVLAFTAAVVCGAAIIFGMSTAWWLLRGSETLDLSGGRASTAARGRAEARSVLVVAESAMALVLLMVGGLFLRSLVQLQQVNPGFKAKGVMTAWIAPPRTTYPGGGPNAGRRDALFRNILQQLQNRPGVVAASLGSLTPFRGEGNAGSFEIEGRIVSAGQTGMHGNDRRVSAGYFESLGIPLKSGRLFTPQDIGGKELVAVIDENLAREYWPNEDPLGKRIRRPDDEWFRIVGIVGHVYESSLASDNGKGTYYFPLLQRTSPAVSIVVKTNGDVSRVPAIIREAVRAADPRLPVHTFESMEDAVARSLAPRKFGMQLVGFFAGVGLFLAALGLYGVISYSVFQRTREIGIRMALGAAKARVLLMIVGNGLRLTAIGAAIGIAMSLASARYIQNQLYGITALDPLTIGAVLAVLLGAAALASYLPARRAVRIDPAIALRPE